MTEEKYYYFVDTRENAKSDKPFGITNADVAKKWAREHGLGESPFKPVKEMEFVKNTYDQKHEKKEQKEQNKGSVYDEMKVDELKAELDAREIEYKAKDTKPELIALLVADDNK